MKTRSPSQVAEFRENVAASLAELTRRIDAVEHRRHEPINTLFSDQVELTRPIVVSLSFEEDEWIARWSEAVLEGHGDSDEEAIDSLRKAIVAAYLDMQETVRRPTPLAGYAAMLWSVLERAAASR